MKKDRVELLAESYLGEAKTIPVKLSTGSEAKRTWDVIVDGMATSWGMTPAEVEQNIISDDGGIVLTGAKLVKKGNKIILEAQVQV